MKLPRLLFLSTTTATASATAPTTPTPTPNAPTTIHLCGDSTMANLAPQSHTPTDPDSSSPSPPPPPTVTQGWGEYLHYSFDPSLYAVHNAAIAGRSARSYTREGRFGAVAVSLRPGDWVVVEFGHNDGGSLGRDNGRSDCLGAGNETCQTTYNGVSEVVQTCPAYLKNATSQFLRAGAAGVILSAPTPNDVWESGSFSWGPDRFAYYAWLAASQMGGPAAGVYFVPHGAYAAQAMRALGADAVRAGYPRDHTHTSPLLADTVMARSFVLGLRCGTSPLGRAVLNATADMAATFLGGCISFNSSMPI